MNNAQSPQAKAITDISIAAIETCEELAKQWQKNIDAPNPRNMHPFGDVIRGMNSQLKIARRLAVRAQRMLKPTDELTVRGILTTCLQACQIAYEFHDEQLSPFIKAYGEPANIENLHRLAHATKSSLEQARFRLTNFVCNPTSDYSLVAFGRQIKERAKSDEKTTKRTTRSKRTSPRRTTGISDSSTKHSS